MGKKQLNIKIDSQLMENLKRGAIRSGQSITEFVSEAIVNKLTNNIPKRQDFEARLLSVESRLSALEGKNVNMLDDSKNLTLSKQEIENFSNFFQGIFIEETKRKNYKSAQDAWNDLISYIDCFEQWNHTLTMRLKEVLFIKGGNPFNNEEMCLLANGKVCPSPLRTGLINWINNKKMGECSCSDKSFPSEHDIYEKGAQLLEELYYL